MRAAALLALLGVGWAPLAAGPIAGVVLERDGDERTPLRKALVLLTSAKSREIVAAAKSDADGRFLLEAPAGVYQLQAQRSGFIRPEGADTIRIDCRQACGPFELELMRGAALSGRAVDELGEPLEGVNVTASPGGEEASPAGQGGRQSRFSRRSVGNARTDDRGRFRMFGLPPGVYDISAVAATRGPTNDIAKATLEDIELRAGEEREVALTVRQELYDRFLMSGRVVLDGVSAEEMRQMRLLARMVDGAPELRRFSMRAEALRPDGSFALRDLPAGRYALQVSSRGRGRSFGRGRSLGTIDLDGNLTGLTLGPLAPAGVEGAVRFEGDEPPSRFAFILRSVDSSDRGSYVSAAMPDFLFRNDSLAPGEYRVESRSRDYFVVEASSNGKPLAERSIRIDEGRIHNLEVVISDRTARVAGVLRRPGGGAAPFVTVTLEDSVGERETQTDQNGRFEFDDVPPGDVVVRAEGLRREFPAAAAAEIDLELTLAP